MPRIKVELVILILIAGLLYAALHHFNEWAFYFTSLTGHINWIYLPAFLRLANVIVLGYYAGSIATGLGVMFLYVINPSTFPTLILNTLAAILSPLLAFWVFKILKNREVSITYLKDLMQLAVIYALMNSITHHLAWICVEPDQLFSFNQVPIMFIGDLVGAFVGALVFNLVVRDSGLIKYIKNRAEE